MSRLDWTEAKRAAAEAGYLIDHESFERVWFGDKDMAINEYESKMSERSLDDIYREERQPMDARPKPYAGYGASDTHAADIQKSRVEGLLQELSYEQTSFGVQLDLLRERLAGSVLRPFSKPVVAAGQQQPTQPPQPPASPLTLELESAIQHTADAQAVVQEILDRLEV